MSTRIIRALQVITDYTQTEETTFAISLSGQPANSSVIFNTTLGVVRVWNGTTFVTASDSDISSALIVKAPIDNPTFTGTVTVPSLAASGNILSSGGGIGYSTGAGGAVTQLTSRSTTVILNKLCGNITMFSAAQAAQAIVTFTLTNSFIAATDLIDVRHISATNGGAWNFSVVAGAGSCTITVRNVSTSSITEATPLRFLIVKSVTS